MHKALKRIVFTGLLAATLPLGLLATTASAATVTQAHVTPSASCYGYWCHGHDPIVYNCSVSSTRSTSDGLMTLWNRYSANCNANWGRAQLSASARNAGYTLQVGIFTVDSHGQGEWMCYPGPSDTGSLAEYCNGSYGGSLVLYSDMVDGTNLASAEAFVFNSSGQEIDYLQVDQ
jgi:hypothetical protein